MLARFCCLFLSLSIAASAQAQGSKTAEAMAAFSQLQEASEQGRNDVKTAALILGGAIGGAWLIRTAVKKLSAEPQTVRELTAQARDEQRFALREAHRLERKNMFVSQVVERRQHLGDNRTRLFEVRQLFERQRLELHALEAKLNGTYNEMGNRLVEAMKARQESRLVYIRALKRSLRALPFIGPVLVGSLFAVDAASNGVAAASKDALHDLLAIDPVGDSTVGPAILADSAKFRKFLQMDSSEAYELISTSPSLQVTLPQIRTNYEAFLEASKDLESN